MLQINIIRQDPVYVKEKLAMKRFSDLSLVDRILTIDDQRKKFQIESEQLQAEINKSSKAIGQLIAKGQKEEAEHEKQSVADYKTRMGDLSAKLTESERLLHEELIKLPNLPSEKVPDGATPEDNIIVREAGQRPSQLSDNALPHWDLIKKYGIIDFETGAKITGTGFPLYIGQGAKLQRALISYFLDFNTAAGYTEFLPPFMVNEASGYGTGQLPDKEGQMYFMPADNYYLIPTAEVPVTNIYRDEIIKEENLPIKMTAYSPCFRREAGSFGKDVRGLNRVHQFEKVEIVQIVHPEKSYEVLEEMVNHVEKLLNTLDLPYRILKLCGGDLSFTSALTYDFEVYSAAQQRWLEVSSVSNFETYQANRAKIRFKDKAGKNQLAHTLNGSALALPRIVAALLENHQKEGFISLPEVLHSYFGSDRIKLR